ncbi:hypothetical protein A3A60_02850 [Candidatus Curtissbacteria bacterium RIFCSPLOWO2_01_FULL_42_26]|uniref:Uncharacterized protein n=1 Tax=Candidatus Curtissbacteria bacterium RIFCSPLOWO2_01_FULL_42_26 TaxID=1797729 RepID=A0A1F5HXE1_9BACT|nr:MAG: hypothetical protein A3A60_02850 [Candidatus Curtissbacteria bacterium RIFCSPLOWO2_01_FULL_42_26]
MAPVETFRNLPHAASFEEGQYRFSNLSSAVRKVCEQRGLLSLNETEDDQTAERHFIYVVGESLEEAYAVVLIGFDASRITGDGWIDLDQREHKLIAPKDIIDLVKLEMESPREAVKFATADPTA